MEEIFKNGTRHNTITVILKGYEDAPLVYKDAIISIPTECVDGLEPANDIIIRCNVNLPINEDKTEYKEYELIEHIPYDNVLRYYTLIDEE